jgi:ribosomal protein L31
MDERVCINCGKNYTRIEKNYRNGRFYPRWANIDGKCHCWWCWKAIVDSKRPRVVEYNNKRNHTRITFKDKRIRLNTKEPRTGRCSWCTNNIKDGSCKRTSLHHRKYILGLPLEHTIEICNSCHIKETRRIRNQDRLDSI